MTKFLAALLCFFGLTLGALAATTKGTPVLQYDNTGTTRCLTIWDLTSPNVDKGVQIGCVNTSVGSWDLPIATRNLQDVTERDLRAFGYRGDGVSRLLNTNPTINGRSTTGWTLSQWQAILPAVTALTDELDWAVLQSFITATGSNSIKITLGPGTATLKKALKWCEPTVAIRGAGDQATILQYSADVNGIEKCINSPDTGRTGTPIYLSDLSLNKTTSGGTGRGIYGKWVPGSIGGGLDNVRINNFNQAGEVWSAGGWHIDHLWGSSGVAAGGSQGNGFSLMGNTVFVVHIQNSQMQGFSDGWHFEAAADYGSPANSGMEDIALRNSGSGETKVCVRIKSTDPNYGPLQWNVENMACQAYEGFVQAEQAAALVINGGSWIISPPVGSWTGVGKDFFLFGRIETASLRNAWLTNNQQTMTISSYIRLYGVSDVLYGGQAHGVTIENNKFEYTNLTPTNSQIWKEFGATAIRVMDNQFTFNFGYVAVPPSNAFKWIDNSTETDSLFYASPGTFKPVSGSVTGIPNTTARTIASLSLDPGIWSCGTSIQYTPSSSTISVLQAGWNTTTNVMPLTPGGGSISEGGTWTGGVIKSLPPYVFDFRANTAATTVYLVGLAAFSGGSVNVTGQGQCVRLR